MRKFSFLLFLALTSQAHGRRSSRGVSSGNEEFGSGSNSFGTTFEGSEGLSGTGSTGVSYSRAGYEGLPESWPGLGNYGGFENAPYFNSDGSFVSGSGGSSGGLPIAGGVSSGGSAASGSIGYAGSGGGSAAVGLPGADIGGALGFGGGVGAGGLGAAVGSDSYAGASGDSAGVGSRGGSFEGAIGVGSGVSGGIASGAGGSALGSLGGTAGGAIAARNADVLAARRRRAQIVGAVVGTTVGGLLLGGLIGGLSHLRRTGRLRHSGQISGFGSTAYEQYGDGIGYRSRYRSGRFYRGYRRGCKTCAYQRRPCFGVGCN